MGFNKCFISYDNINRILDLYGEEYLVNLYKKCDCFIGDSESIDLLTSIMKKYKDNPPDLSHPRIGSKNQIPEQPSEK